MNLVEPTERQLEVSMPKNINAHLELKQGISVCIYCMFVLCISQEAFFQSTSHFTLHTWQVYCRTQGLALCMWVLFGHMTHLILLTMNKQANSALQLCAAVVLRGLGWGFRALQGVMHVFTTDNER